MKTWKSFLWMIASIAVPLLSGPAMSAEFPQQQLDPNQGGVLPAYAMPDPGVPVQGAVPGPAFDPGNPWGPPPPGAPACEPGTLGCSICGGGSCSPPCWYVEQGVRVLTRNRPRLVRLAERIEGLVISPALDTRSESFDISASYQATLGRYIGRDACNNDRFLEVSYWGLNEWELDTCAGSTGRIPYSVGGVEFTGGNLFTEFPFGVVGFTGAELIEADYDHKVHNIEVNYWVRPRGRADRLVLKPNGRWVRECQPGCYVSYLVGLRTMTVDDGFAMFARGDIDIADGDAGVDTAGVYRVDTDNILLGFQLGTEIEFRNCRWSWGGRFRVAPFVNLADQETNIVADQLNAAGDALGAPLVVRGYAENEGAAAAIELGLMADYRLSAHCLVELGYDVMWISGVALAPEQVDFNLNACNDLNDGGTVFYHGLTASLKFAW